jgi:hypothetical protein
MRWSPKKRTIDSEVGALALAISLNQLLLTPASSDEARRVKEKRGEEPQRRRFPSAEDAHSLGRRPQLPARVTDRGSLALASHGHSSRPFGFTQCVIRPRSAGVPAAPRVAAPTEHAQLPERIAAAGKRDDVVGGQVGRCPALLTPRMRSVQEAGAALALGAVWVRLRAGGAAAAPLRDERAAVEARPQDHAGRFGGRIAKAH